MLQLVHQIKNEIKLKNEMVTKVMQVRGSKVKGHTLLKRNPKGRLHHDLSLVFQRCLSLGKLEHFGRHSSSFFGKKIFT